MTSRLSLNWIGVAGLSTLVTGCGKGDGASLDWGTAAQWGEVPGETSWEWILDTEALSDSPPAVDFLGLEGLDVSARFVEAAVDQGSTPWCYLSVGSAEDWRDDYAELVALDEAERAACRDGILGRDYDGWEGERWLNVADYPVFIGVMEARLDVCAAKGFRLVEYDNMETDGDTAGFDFGQAEVREYVGALLDATEARGMGAIHKNATHLIDLEPRFDALLLEDCVLWSFCAEAEPYVSAGKPVFNAEYPQSWRDEGEEFDLDRVCRDHGGVSTLVKRLSLDADTIVCAAQGD